MEQERRSMKARQAMLESKLPSERERRRGGSKECTWKVKIVLLSVDVELLMSPEDMRGLDRGGDPPARVRWVRCRGRMTEARTRGQGPAAPRSTRRSGG